MTGKTKVWPVKSTISPDIVRWPAVISSPRNTSFEITIWSRTGNGLTDLVIKRNNWWFITETWRTVIDCGKFVAVAFIDFRKAFNSVPHTTLIMKLQRHFGIKGSTLDWLKSYLTGRKQFTVLNGVESDLLPVSMGIPQGSVLGSTLFTLFTNDLSPSVRSGTKARVLGLTVDPKLTWDAHLMDAKKSFADKLDLLKRSRFLPKSFARLLRLFHRRWNTGRVVTRTYVIQLKDFIAEHLESFLTYQETCLQKRCWPMIDGLPFSYTIN